MGTHTYKKMSYSKHLTHIVFITKDREPVLTKPNRERLFKYISKVIVNRGSVSIKVNGVEDHVHILCDVHTSERVADLVKAIKVSTNKMIKDEELFPDFECWQKGYASISLSESHLHSVMKYISEQESHHQKVDSKDEFFCLMNKNGIDFDEKYIV